MERVKARQKAWYAANAEKVKAKVAAHKDANQEKVIIGKRIEYRKHRQAYSANAKKRRVLHSGKVREEHAKHYAANKGKVKEACTRWRKANPGKVKAIHSARRAKKLGNGGRHTDTQVVELLQLWQGKCAYCGVTATELDHVVSIYRGGTDNIDNILPACKPCNTSKGSRSLDEWLTIRLCGNMR